MNPRVGFRVKENLKDLKLTVMQKKLEPPLKDAKFPLMKFMENFDFEKTQDLAARLVKPLSICE